MSNIKDDSSILSIPFCPLCDKPFQLFLSNIKDPQTQDSFSIVHCDSCHLQKTMPEPIDIKRYYSDYYQGNRHGFTARICANRRVKWINPFHVKSGKLLDIGCGDGAFLLAAKSYDWKTFGTEMNPMKAKKKGVLVFDDIRQAENHAPFDCITLWHTLEHMSDPLALLHRLRLLLSAGGVLWIAVPNAGGWQSQLFGKHWIHRDVPRHLYHFNPKSLQKLLNKAGFKMIQSAHQEFEYDVLGWSQSMLNCVSKTPNQFFHLLTGKKKNARFFEKIILYLVGVVISAFSLPLLFFSAMAKSGGTLIVAAKRNDIDYLQ